MTLIQSIRNLLNPPKPTGIPFALHPEEFAILRELTTHEAWPTYQALLDKLITFHAEQLLATDADNEVHRQRGFILGLRKAGTLVTELIRQQEYEDVRRTKLDRGASSRDTERALAYYGTRYGGA